MSALSLLFLLASPALGQFIYVNSAKNQNAANEYCKSRYGTSLATIKNEYDAAVLKEKERVVNKPMWIGVNDLNRENVWEWTSGYKCDSGNCRSEPWWHTNQPNGDGDCAAVAANAISAQSMVSDTRCSHLLTFFCDAPAVVDASTLGVAIGWEDYVLYAVAALNVVLLTCLVVFCLCTQQTAKYGKVASYDSDSKL